MIAQFRSTVRALGAAALLAAPAALHGQRDASADSLPAYLLEGVTVTATRAPALRIDLPQKVEVVTRAALERTIGNDVTDALKRNAAVDVIQYPGLLSGVSVRGFRPQFSGISARTLLLVDGRPAGTTNLSTVDVAAVERIEILRGPASALYGSNAMGGAVNIVTRKSSGPLRGTVSGRYGSFQTYRGELTAGGELVGALDFDLALATAGQGAGYRIGGSRLLAGDSVLKTLRGGNTRRVAEVAVDTVLDFSEHSYRAGSLRLGYALGSGWRLDGRGGAFLTEGAQNPGDLLAVGYDPRSVKDLERYTGDLALTGVLARHALTVRGYASSEVGSYYSAPVAPHFVSFRTPIRWYGAQLQDVVRLGAHSLTAGLDYSAAEAESERYTREGTRGAPFSPNSGIYSAAAFAQAQLGLLEERLTATLGGRLDRVAFSVRPTELLPNHRAGDEDHLVFNPSAGLLYRAPAGVRLHASAGRAFVTPDAFNVAGYAELRAGTRAVRVTRGNPELDPESSVTWDAGVGIFRPRLGLDADVSFFRTDVRGRITSQPLPAAGLQLTAAGDTIKSVVSYVNADEAEIRGLEGNLSYDFGARAGYAYSLRLFANATRILEAEESTGATAAGIKNVADLTAVFGLEYDDLERVGARLSGRYVGERLDTDWSDWMNPGDVRYPEFLVFDLSTTVRLAERYRLGVQLANLTDENYYEVRGYNLPGRSLLVHFGVSF